MFKRKSLLALGAAALMGLTLSVGATFAQDAATPVPLPTATDIPPIELGSGGTHISFWNGLTGYDGVTLIDMLTPFTKDHPDISVTVEQIPWNTLYTKLQAAFVAGQPPDVIILHASE